MPPRRTSSPPSPRSSIELGPSRLVAGALVSLGLLAAVSAGLSAAPRAVALALGLVALGGSVIAARREMRRSSLRLDFLADGRVMAGASPLDDVRLRWQGPIAILDARDGGRPLRLLGWPDQLDAASRRELRLWALETRPARRPPTVAP